MVGLGGMGPLALLTSPDQAPGLVDSFLISFSTLGPRVWLVLLPFPAATSSLPNFPPGLPLRLSFLIYP